VLRLEDGSQVTVPLDTIREAGLVVDWEILGKRR
jgi:hypothetical protein